MLHYNVLFHVNHLGCLARRFSLSPTNLHCSQTHTFYRSPKPLFVSPTNLHYSQTVAGGKSEMCMFVSPTNLHYSQTVVHFNEIVIRFVSPTNLHYSQTPPLLRTRGNRLFPLRIYTTLKHSANDHDRYAVCFPYEFTLLSNCTLLL